MDLVPSRASGQKGDFSKQIAERFLRTGVRAQDLPLGSLALPRPSTLPNQFPPHSHSVHVSLGPKFNLTLI